MIQHNWSKFIEIMDARSLPLEIVTQPQNYREQQHSAIRVAAVRLMIRSGLSTQEIQKVCPLKLRRLQEMCQKYRVPL